MTNFAYQDYTDEEIGDEEINTEKRVTYWMVIWYGLDANLIPNQETLLDFYNSLGRYKSLSEVVCQINIGQKTKKHNIIAFLGFETPFSVVYKFRKAYHGIYITTVKPTNKVVMQK